MSDNGEWNGASSEWHGTSVVGRAWEKAGFRYDSANDYNYSRIDAKQRQFGYAYGYDAFALPCGMNIDCEPVFFEYDGKQWMIELWKGQYGIETGGEIGVYYRDPLDGSPELVTLDSTIGQRPDDEAHSLFYLCVDDDNMLGLQFQLNKNGHELFFRESPSHWWLTGFRWGVYAEPSELTMDVKITFPTLDMQKAFKNALKDMGYGYDDNYKSSSDHLWVKFTYSTPKSVQPPKDNGLVDSVNQFNQNSVDVYNHDKAGMTHHGLNPNDPNNFGANAALIAVAAVRANGGLAYQALRQYLNQLDINIQNSLLEAVSEISLFDYGCVVQVVNKTGHTLSLTSSKVKHGHWLSDYQPPDSIPKSSNDSIAAVFVLRDNAGIHGAEGSLTYRYTDGDNEVDYLLSFDCPTGVAQNVVKAPNRSTNSYFVTSTSGNSDSDWGNHNEVPKYGHPLYIKYYLKT